MTGQPCRCHRVFRAEIADNEGRDLLERDLATI
jgi:hypothetical protein